jgi:hypothetical protein
MIDWNDSKYKYWIKNPIDIDPDEDINKNISNSPGYIIRDYRFYPKLISVDPTEYEPRNGIIRRPTKLQLFYAWELNNEQQALKDHKKHVKYRKKGVDKDQEKRFTKMYMDKNKVYYIYNDIVRADYINLISNMIYSKKYDDNLKLDAMKLLTVIEHTHLIIYDYDESIYKKFIERLLNLIYYIFAIKFNNYDLIEIILLQKNINLNKYLISTTKPDLILDQLININNAVKIL